MSNLVPRYQIHTRDTDKSFPFSIKRDFFKKIGSWFSAENFASSVRLVLFNSCYLLKWKQNLANNVQFIVCDY